MTLNEDVLEKLDAVMGKLRDMEQEFILQMGKYEHIGDIEEKIEELEKRVHKLEHPAT